MKREGFASQLGFLLVSAGCAIGIGNVWKFPYVTGANGGGVFVLFYLLFLVIMGVPVLTMELAVGRASRTHASMRAQSAAANSRDSGHEANVTLPSQSIIRCPGKSREDPMDGASHHPISTSLRSARDFFA